MKKILIMVLVVLSSLLFMSCFISDLFGHSLYVSNDGRLRCKFCSFMVDEPYYAIVSSDGSIYDYSLIRNSMYCNHSDKARNVVLYTNGEGYEISIDAPKDTITHYGTAENVFIEAVGDHSYIGNAVCNQIEIKTGHLVLNRDVEKLIINENAVHPTVSINGIVNSIHVFSESQIILEEKAFVDNIQVNADSVLVQITNPSNVNTVSGDCIATITDLEGKDIIVREHEHLFQVINELAPTCTESGYSLQKCKCGKTEKHILQELGHSTDQKTELNKNHFWQGKHSVVYYCCKCDTYFSDASATDKAKNIISLEDLNNTGIPTIIINTVNNQAILDKDNWINGNIFVYEEEKEGSLGKISIKGRGNTTWGMEKKPYNIKLDDKSKVLGMKKAKKWALLANYSDKTLLRNWFASYLANNVFDFEWAPSCQFCNLVLNGEYLGNYNLFEKVEIGSNRVNITDITEDLNYGFILEVNDRKDEKNNFQSNHGVNFSLSDPEEPDGEGNHNGPAFSRIVAYINEVEDYLFDPNFCTDITIDYIDVDSFIDWYLINEFTKNNDAIFYSSVYMNYCSEDKKLHMGPIWDFDISCGNINYNGCDNPEGYWIMGAKWYKKLFTNPVFVKELKSRWNEKKSQLLIAIEEIYNKADEISDSAEINFNRWNILGKYVWPNAEGYELRTTYQSEVDYMVGWLKTRLDWLDSEINNL